jgi:hypothetical protein
MIRELDAVVLTRNLPKQGLKRGDVGIVVLLHGSVGYGIEFLTPEGETIAVVSLTTDLVRPMGRVDQPDSRSGQKHGA